MDTRKSCKKFEEKIYIVSIYDDPPYKNQQKEIVGICLEKQDAEEMIKRSQEFLGSSDRYSIIELEVGKNYVVDGEDGPISL